MVETLDLECGFQKTEIGIIPFDWEVKVLGNIASFRRGSFPQPYGLTKWYDEQNGMPFIQVFDVDDNMKLKPETKQKISAAAKDKSVFVPKGSIVLTIQGSIGRIAMTQYDSYVDRTLLIFRSFFVPMDKWYFMYAVYQKFQIEKHNAPGGTIKTITKEELSSFKIPLPPGKAEQASIGSALNDIGKLIASLDRLIVKKRNIRRGAIQELMRPKEDWVEKRLADCLIQSPDYGINAAAVPFNESLPLYLRITDITEDGKYTKTNIASVSNPFSSAYYLENDDLVFARTGASVGKTYLYDLRDGKLVFAGFLIRIKSNPKILLPGYLKYFTQTKGYKDWIKANSMRTGQPGINGNEYQELILNLPPNINEQQRITEILTSMEEEIELLETKMEKLKMIKQGMMKELLTGKIRLI